MPSAGLLLFPEDVEKDDYLHNPSPDDKEEKCDIWNRRGLMNMGGLLVITLGILVLFIAYPVLYALPSLRLFLSNLHIKGPPSEMWYTYPILKPARRM